MKKRGFCLKTAAPEPEIIAVLCAAAIISGFLLVRPIIGVADNGDFGRIMESAGLRYISQEQADRYFGFANREYAVGRSSLSKLVYLSSELILVELAKLLNAVVFCGRGIFDIRSLALIYSIVFLAAIYLLVRFGAGNGSPLSKWLLAGFLVFVFTDVGYISYFNSLYGEAVSLSFLLLAAGAAFCLARQKNPGIPVLLLFFIAAAFLTAAKAQNAPIGIIAALFVFRLYFLRKDPVWKRLSAAFSIMLAVVSAICYVSVPGCIKVCNKYQSVFYGILKDSPSPENDLGELGIRRDFAVLAGTHFFMENYPMDIKDPNFLEEIDININHFKIALYYARHPGRFIRKLRAASRKASTLMHGLGNFEKADGAGYGETAENLALWSRFKNMVIPNSLTFFTIFYALHLIAFPAHLAGKRKKDEKSNREWLRLEICSFIALIGIAGFIVPIIGDGEADLIKHLFLFNACTDLLLVLGIARLPQSLAWAKEYFINN